MAGVESKDRQLWKPDVLVLGPGGIKGFSELGALFRLNDYSIISDNIHTYSGVSVGAIISLLLSIKCDINEIIMEGKMDNFSVELCSINIEQIIKCSHGVLSMDPIRKRVEKLVRATLNLTEHDPIPTLLDLYRRTGKTYEAVAVNMTSGKPEYLSWSTHPSLGCVEAAMMSSALPLIFHKIVYMGTQYVDGGLGDPYPVTRYDNGRNNVLGIYIEGKSEEPPAPVSLGSYITRFLHVPLVQLRRINIEKSSLKVRHLRLSTSVVSMLGIGMTILQKATMICDGYVAAEAFVQTLYLKDKEKERNEFLASVFTPQVGELLPDGLLKDIGSL